MPTEGERPPRTQVDEWLELMPFAPAHRTTWGWLNRDNELDPNRRRTASEEEGLANARSLENRLRRAGWLNAEVQASWVPVRSGSELQLVMSHGHRWHLDSIRWVVAGSGLSRGPVQEAANLKSGDPFEMSWLQDAQDRVAEYAQSTGHSTFHSGYVTFEVDTLGRSKTHGVALTVRCVPWDVNTASWSDASGLHLEEELPHPRVKIGEVTWNGESQGSVASPGGLRAEVWDHLTRTESNRLYKPADLSSTYAGLSALRFTDQVVLTQTMRWDTSASPTDGLPNQAWMDVDFTLVPKSSHDVGVELDMIRNDARYGPRLSSTLLHRNPRGWGAENAWEVSFGYVAVAPFSSLNRQTLLNSGEWSVRWRTEQIGLVPLPLSRLKPSTAPFTSMDVGWDREVWPEFTRSQFHVQHDLGFTENPVRGSNFHVSPVNVSFVNLTNRDSAFEAWLSNQANPLIQARFNNHLTLGSAAAWETGWRRAGWKGRCHVQTSWAGMLAQRLAERWAPAVKFDEESGAWMVADNVPLIQHQRILTSVSASHPSRNHTKSEWAFHALLGWANAGANTPSLPLEQSFFTGGANGVRGWRLRTLGPGVVSSEEAGLAVLGLGDVRVDVQMEWRLALDKTWALAAFSDAGNVWLHGDEAPELATFQWGNWSSIGWSAGLGLRYDLEFFLLRLDGALRLHDPSQPEAMRWIGSNGVRGALHLGLGLPF